MEPSSRNFRSRPENNESQEAVPFLTTVRDESDVELQSLDSNRKPPYSDHPHISHGLDTEVDRLDEDLEPGLSVTAPSRRTQRKQSVLRSILAYIPVTSKTRSGIYGTGDNHNKHKRRFSIRTCTWRTLTILLMISGLVQFGTLVLGLVTAFFPEKLDHAYRTWRSQDHLDDLSRWPTDYTADILPVACHSHNDYWRRIPLKSAIKAGCTGVEADVWLLKNDLYVGHAESALKPNRTFQTLYVNPLVELLERQNPLTDFQTTYKVPRNGVFDTDPSQTLVLLIDFKTRYQELWPVVSSQLEPLRQRQYLTHFNGTAVIQGPITVVVTGNAPFDYVVSDLHYRDMFFDAPLDRLASVSNSPESTIYDPSLEVEYLASIGNGSDIFLDDKNQGQGHSGHPPPNPAIFSRANSFYASVDFKTSIGWPQPYLSPAQREKIASQIAGAHAQGLKVRYWDVPSWPIGLRNYLWRELVKMGIDYLNVDDLYSATRGDWKSGYSIWDWSLWGGRDW